MTRWLTPAEMTAWRAYVETVGHLTAALERDLAPTGLTAGDYQVLVTLSEAPDTRMRMSDLALRLQLTPSGLTRRLDGLVQAGYVERAACPTDGRAAHAVLTPAGAQALAAAAPVHVESVRRRLLDHLSPAQISALGEIFTAIRPACLDRVQGSTT